MSLSSQSAEIASNVRTHFWVTIKYKYHGEKKFIYSAIHFEGWYSEIEPGQPMVLISDGNPEIGAHVYRKIDNFICVRYLFSSAIVSNMKLSLKNMF